MKYNGVLLLLNRTFQALYELNDFTNESKDHIETKKEAIKEGVLTCLNYLGSSSHENNPITPTINSKKKIIIKKKNFDILQDKSEDDDDDDDDDENDKENQSTTSIVDENVIRRKTVRGSNPSKRSVSLKEKEDESPSKRTKKTVNIDEPLAIISPAVVKKSTPSRKKANEKGEEKNAKSLRLVRKVNDLKSAETTKLTKKQKNDEMNVKEDHSSVSQAQDKSIAPRKKPALLNKSSMDVRNDKGESLIHQAVKKGDITRVKRLITEGHSVNTIDHNSWTPLHEVNLNSLN